MSTDILTLAYALRVASATSSQPIKLSHAQQLLAAALGYRSLAAYQAATNEPKHISDHVYILVDSGLLLDRAFDLCADLNHDLLLSLISSAFRKELPKASLYTSAADLGDALNEMVQDHVPDDAKVASQTAMTNSDGIREVYFELALTEDDLPDIGDYLILPGSGHMTMEQDIERPYSGHHVDIEITVSAERLGHAIFAPPTIAVDSAKLDFGWGEDDEAEYQTRATFAQALADELDLDIAEAEQLTEVEPEELTGNSGESAYSIIFDFTEIAPPEIARKILAKHGTLKVKVAAHFFDRVIRDYN